MYYFYYILSVSEYSLVSCIFEAALLDAITNGAYIRTLTAKQTNPTTSPIKFAPVPKNGINGPGVVQGAHHAFPLACTIQICKFANYENNKNDTWPRVRRYYI